MDFNRLIDEIIKEEGSGVVTNDPADSGGRTQFGISERSFPEAWADDKVTLDEARGIFMDKFIKGPGFDRIPDQYEPIVRQLVDWSVTSGPYLPILSLQKALGVKQDGKLGPLTLAALVKADVRTINNSLVKERILMIGRIVHKAPSQARFIDGWLQRALSYMV